VIVVDDVDLPGLGILHSTSNGGVS